MKGMGYKCILRGSRKFLLTLVIIFSIPLMADDDWTIVFQNAYGETQQIPMIEVGSLVSVDEAYDFSILSTSGEVLAEGVTRVSFHQGDITKIEPIVESGSHITYFPGHAHAGHSVSPPHCPASLCPGSLGEVFLKDRLHTHALPDERAGHGLLRRAQRQGEELYGGHEMVPDGRQQ